MYKLIIADDEKRIRNGLAKGVDWKRLGFEVGGIFADGEEVLDYLREDLPDVILTDIKMNKVGGVELAKFIFENHLPCRLVFLSGYKEFELARQGMRYGVEDYLLKPTDLSLLQASFIRCREKLDQERQRKEERKKEKQHLEEMLPVLREQFWNDLFFGVLAEDEEEFCRKARLLFSEIPLAATPCAYMEMTINDYEQYMNHTWQYHHDQFRYNLENFFAITDGPVKFYMVYKSGARIGLMGFLAGKKTEREQRYEEGMEKIQEELRKIFNLNTVFRLKYQMDSLFEMSQYRKQIFLPEQREEGKEFLEEQTRLVITNVRLGNLDTAQKIFHRILKELDGTRKDYSDRIIIELFSAMTSTLKEECPAVAEYIRSHCNYSVIISMQRLEAVAEYCDQLFDGIRVETGKQGINQDHDSLIRRVQQYIEENITKDISLETAAKELFISSSYLSRLFRKQTGENFVQFVTRKKMEKAVELLHNAKYKTYQVGEYLGYKTPRYFSKLFRMQMGMNPSEYRNQVLHLGGQDEL